MARELVHRCYECHYPLELCNWPGDHLEKCSRVSAAAANNYIPKRLYCPKGKTCNVKYEDHYLASRVRNFCKRWFPRLESVG